MKKATIFRESERRPVEPLAYRPREAAEALGISVSTLERLTRAGEIPSVLIGRVRVFEREALAEFLRRRRNSEGRGTAIPRPSV